MPKQTDRSRGTSVDPMVAFGGKWAGDGDGAISFEGCERTVEVFDVKEVLSAIEQVELAVRQDRLHAVGFVSYEAAPGFDPALSTLPAAGLPLLWFAFFRRKIGGSISSTQEHPAISWAPTMNRGMYESALARIAGYIIAGDTYQVNFTMKMKALLSNEPDGLYDGMCDAQGNGYFARIDTGAHLILSASPELFFQLEDSQLTACPMKGTRPRGRWLAEDEELSHELATSAKDRAENVMITDLLRNDMGRISLPGSVSVPALWQVEQYKTVWQMTSTIRSRLQPEVGLGDLFTALFPCGSVTGAPKIRTMQILAELEMEPRGIYTGSIGFLSPDERSPDTSGRLSGIKSTFSVAIRTACIERVSGRAEFGTGSGVTHSSTPEAEYEECLVKSRVLTQSRREFSLLETMLFEPGEGYFLLSRHLERLHESAVYFGFQCDIDRVTACVTAHGAGLGQSVDIRVRLTVSPHGDIDVTSEPLADLGDGVMVVNLEPDPVDSGNPLLYHKTTDRQVFDVRRNRHLQSDDIVLQNERGELTECSIGNLVILREGQYLTPRAESGLLKGTFRAELLETGQIAEEVLHEGDLKNAEGLFMINSVRRWVRLELAERSSMAV